MPRVREVPVHDSTRVRDVRVAAGAAARLAGLGEDRVAAAELVATDPLYAELAATQFLASVDA